MSAGILQQEILLLAELPAEEPLPLLKVQLGGFVGF